MPPRRAAQKRLQTMTSDDEDNGPAAQPSQFDSSPDIQEISVEVAQAYENAKCVAYKKRWKTEAWTAEEVLGVLTSACYLYCC